MGAGKKAAADIHHYLMGTTPEAQPATAAAE